MKPTDFIPEKHSIGQAAINMHVDHEIQMAREECYHAATNAMELHRMLKHVSEEEGLQAWASEKITLANDYLRTVKEWLEYEIMTKLEQSVAEQTPAPVTVGTTNIVFTQFSSATGVLPISRGGTGANTASQALSNLGGIGIGKAIAAAIVFGSLFPIVTVLLAYKFLHERLHKVQYIGIVAALLGVIAISIG